MATVPHRADVLEAADRVYRFARHTSLVRDPGLSERLDCDVLLKLETEQPVGSFKVRGAANKLIELTETEVIAASSGNHGIAVAYVASRLGKRATIVLPENVNPRKEARIRELGATTIRHGVSSEERGPFARELARQKGSAYIPSFDDPRIITGQGTLGLEIQNAISADAILCPVGGGGLISGIALAYEGSETALLFGVQPEGAASMQASLSAGKPVSIPVDTIADGISVSRPGELTFSIVRDRVQEILTVSDTEILTATQELWQRSGRLIEPASASVVAAALRWSEKWKGLAARPTLVLVISGGNISDEIRDQVTRAGG
ncbi:MAG: threonine/serine dehydratase [Thermoplasmata archaeon]